jgi:hypothetical protein
MADVIEDHLRAHLVDPGRDRTRRFAQPVLRAPNQLKAEGFRAHATPRDEGRARRLSNRAGRNASEA